MIVLWRAWRPSPLAAERSQKAASPPARGVPARNARGLIETETAKWPGSTKSAHSLPYALRC
jgi:hypothetical protein